MGETGDFAASILYIFSSQFSETGTVAVCREQLSIHHIGQTGQSSQICTTAMTHNPETTERLHLLTCLFHLIYGQMSPLQTGITWSGANTKNNLLQQTTLDQKLSGQNDPCWFPTFLEQCNMEVKQQNYETIDCCFSDCFNM